MLKILRRTMKEESKSNRTTKGTKLNELGEEKRGRKQGEERVVQNMRVVIRTRDRGREGEDTKGRSYKR